MFEEDKNLKDTHQSSAPARVSLNTFNMSYSKTDKLIAALFMVTDIIDRDDPLRNKLRTLGTEIVSDMHINPVQARSAILEILSFLNIAFSINLISEMNCNILRKEFLELFNSIQDRFGLENKQISIQDFFTQTEGVESNTKAPSFTTHRGYPASHNSLRNGQPRTRIGVQKGGNLMRALSEKTHSLYKQHDVSDNVVNFDTLRNQRRDDIIKILKDIKQGATIKDIKIFIKDKSISSLISLGEKTLQRELIAMVKDGVLNKTGEKRWSRYFSSSK